VLCHFIAGHVFVFCLPTLMTVMILVSSNALSSKTNYLLTDGNMVKENELFFTCL